MRYKNFWIGFALLVSISAHISLLALNYPSKTFTISLNSQTLKARLVNPSPQIKKSFSKAVKPKPAKPKKDALKPITTPKEPEEQKEEPNIQNSTTADFGTEQKETGINIPSEYLAQVIAKIQQAKRYPLQARIKGIEGKVEVKFTLSRDGRLINSEIITSSGFKILDQEALAMLRRASPFPPFPSSWLADEMNLKIKITFRLSE